MSKAISYPFNVQINGAIDSTEVPTKIYLDRVLTLLGTNVGQRPMLPKYGVDWSLALFENDGNASLAIPRAIAQAINTWLPAISVQNITVTPDYATGTENVTVDLKLPNNTITSLTVNSATLNYDGTVM